MHRSLLLLVLAAPVTAGPLLCMWDYDTLQQEEARFPNTIELLTGRFPRHSDAYYRWRIEDRELKLENAPDSPELMDDLAVAWSKLGEDAKAIELMEDKESRWPGQYETAANLGTFYIHAGDFESGAKHIARAIEINPDAHFGREVYQLLLVRYVLSKKGGASVLPLESESTQYFRSHDVGFWSFIEQHRKVTDENLTLEIDLAVKGVLGMLRFGNYDSPILCEALADLLLVNRETDAKNLAARAFLQASYGSRDAATREAYRVKARSALLMQTPASGRSRSVTLIEIGALFDAERAEARAWWKTLEEDEARWIASGEDVDARFSEKYYGIAKRAGASAWLSLRFRSQLLLGLGVILLGLAFARHRYRSSASALVA